ncbi:MAG: xanthine dehydrogenase family protein molybdopterin-binding subunit [Proteobacteria bacterium]|jgi:isoquinoline 1-oxidoreductase subunit beta|nr:xanthine dehydrogenase family protein molybdopterin-binding subunit [Pseudomonadota bacterium]
MAHKRNSSESAASPEITRRQFLNRSAGVTFVIGATGIVGACSSDEPALEVPMADSEPFTPNIWVTLFPDNTVEVKYSGTEMGQGSSTHAPVILAEHLDVDWENVNVHTVAVHDEAYGNPFFRNILYTAGSTTIMVFSEKMRAGGAQARKMLLQAVSDQWAVPVTELSTDLGVVSHAESDRTISYGEIVSSMPLPTEVPELEESDFKPASEFRYIGKDVMRQDVPDKSTGEAYFGMDVQVDGMAYAAVVRAPVEDETALSFDDSEAREVDGVTDVINFGHMVAVVGDSVEATKWGKAKLKIDWSETSRFRQSESQATLEKYTVAALDLGITGPIWSETGDAKQTLADADETVDALYTSEPVYHAQMEPLNATAHVSDDGLSAEIWAGSQTQSLTVLGSAETLGTTHDKITFHPLTMGGGFGRRSTLHQQYIDDALLISRDLKRPIKVIWSREDDMESGLFRPAAAQYMRAGFDAEGNLTTMHHRVSAPNCLPTMNPLRWAWAEPKDVITMLGSESTTYDIPNHQAEHVVQVRESRVCAWRGVSTSYTKFAVESFIDELAEHRGVDPMDYRLQLCHNNPRMIDLLNELKSMSNWGEADIPEGRARGLAVSGYGRSLSAGIVELSLEESTGKITVHKVWAVADSGQIISPKNSNAQLEGNLIFGLSSVLKERITIEGGVVQQANYNTYPILRMSEVPELDCKVLITDNPPSGVGETGLAMLGPAIANGLASLTGKRIRHLPLTPEIVRAELSA